MFQGWRGADHLPASGQKLHSQIYEAALPKFQMGLQAQHSLDVAKDHFGKRLDRKVRLMGMAE